MPPRWAHAEVPKHRQLRLGVDVLTRLPVVVDVSGGLAIVANGVLGASVWRAIHGLLDWLYSPNDAEEAANHGLVRMYAENGMVPSNASLVLRVQADGTAVLTDFRRLASNTTMLDVDLLTSPEFNAVKERIESTRAELAPRGAALLASNFTVADLDLVRHGPHALLVGMTGSGKTEFLLTWLVSLAETHTPEELNILLLDYKGGVGLGRLSGLPHVVGLVSDLSPAVADRVLVSLRAEVRTREQVLAEHGAHDVAVLAPGVLPRLVVVIDEYRALLDSTPEAAAVFADLASRGRALGIHLVLSTQQLGGLSESILANCALRVCFRMTAAHDSRTLLGGDAASSLPHEPGSALVRGTGLELTQLRFAMTDASRLASMTQAARDWVAVHPDWAPRIPWCEPLPAVLSELPANLVLAHNPRTPTALSFGLSDLPHEQRQELAVWDPAHDGHLHVQGGLGSGRSTALRTLTAAARDSDLETVSISTAEQLWDSVVSREVVGHAGVSGSAFPRKVILVIDDLDALIASFSIEHREAFLAALQIRLRTAPAEQTWFVLGTLDHGSTCAWVGQLVRTSLKLQTPARGSAPGLTAWHGHETRVLNTPATAARTPNSEPPMQQTWLPGQGYLIVTHRMRQIIRSLTEQGVPVDAVHDVGLPISVEHANPANPRIYVGDTESWQANYNLLGQLRREATIIFDGCTPSEVRTLRLHRGLLPHAGPDHALAVTPEGDFHRIKLVVERPDSSAGLAA